MQTLNDFISNNQDTLREFYNELVDKPDEGPVPEVDVPESIVTSSLVQVYLFLVDNQERIFALLMQHDEGLADELRTLLREIGEIDAY